MVYFSPHFLNGKIIIIGTFIDPHNFLIIPICGSIVMTESPDFIDLSESPPSSAVKAEAAHAKIVNRGCTGCSRGNDAEYIHPILKVDLCGYCWKSYLDATNEKALYSTSSSSTGGIEQVGDLVCLWCHDSDGRAHFLCDNCPHAFCHACIKRNLGRSALTSIAAHNSWMCLSCDPSPLVTLTSRTSDPIYNMEAIYSSVKSPSIQAATSNPGFSPQQALAGLKHIDDSFTYLSVSERNLATIFTPFLCNHIFHSAIFPYLDARDIASVRRISKNMHQFMREITLMPGLFGTSFGEEYHCKLFPHQMWSLKAMIDSENSTNEFGHLRGTSPDMKLKILYAHLLFLSLIYRRYLRRRSWIREDSDINRLDHFYGRNATLAPKAAMG